MTGSRYFVRSPRRAYRPRTPGEKRSYSMSVPAETMEQVEREAEAAQVSLSAFYQRGAVMLAQMTEAERERGLFPISCWGTDEELALWHGAAARAGHSLDNWISRTLYAAANAAQDDGVRR